MPPNPRSELQLRSQFAILDLGLDYFSIHIGIFVVGAGVHIESIGVPGANYLTALDGSFAQGTTFVRACSVEHADRSVNVGYAQRSTRDREFSHLACRWQLALRTNAHKV
jgi:hypothetical protein